MLIALAQTHGKTWFSCCGTIDKQPVTFWSTRKSKYIQVGFGFVCDGVVFELFEDTVVTERLPATALCTPSMVTSTTARSAFGMVSQGVARVGSVLREKILDLALRRWEPTLYRLRHRSGKGVQAFCCSLGRSHVSTEAECWNNAGCALCALWCRPLALGG